ncbi:MAG: hypothetical protein M3Y87_30815, partial [Myxococcota bacterium]|nr:hypothetical protein [Myxococcota bacterium]
MTLRRSLVLLALASLVTPMTACSSCEAPHPESAVAPEDTPADETLAAQSFRLPSGLEVELVTGPCGERAAVVVLFEVGADHDPPGRSGMAHVVERLLATPGAPGQVEGGRDSTQYSVVTERDRLLAELDAIAARLARLETSEEELARARAEVLEDGASRHGGDATRTATSYAAESVRPTR